MDWVLTVCTAAWIMCGSEASFNYETESQCYKAMDILYARHGEKGFNWVICAPSQSGVNKNEQ